MFLKRSWLGLLVAVSASLLARTSRADTTSYVGNLRVNATVTDCGAGCTLGASGSDAAYAQFAAVVVPVTVSQKSLFSAVSFSYGGGVNGAGTTVLPSGFEPYLSLFDGSGGFLGSTYLGTTCPAGAHTNASLGGCYDVALSGLTLLPGTYSLALTAFQNMSYAENLGLGVLGDGFTGLGNLAQGEDLHYAFDVTTTPTDVPPTSPVPEPAGMGLVVSALAMAVNGARQYRKRRRA